MFIPYTDKKHSYVCQYMVHPLEWLYIHSVIADFVMQYKVYQEVAPQTKSGHAESSAVGKLELGDCGQY